MDQEFQQLKQEIVRISETHEWNGFPILNGKAGSPVGWPVSSTQVRAAVMPGSTAINDPIQLNEGDLEIEYIDAAGAKVSTAIPASDDFSSADTVSVKSDVSHASTSDKSASAISIAAAINSKVGITGVYATANAAVITGTKTTVSDTPVYTDLYVNGVKISMSLSSGQTFGERRKFVIDSINAKTSDHGVLAGDSGNGGLTLKTIDGRNLSVWYDGDLVDGSEFGLGANTATASDPDGVKGLKGTGIKGESGYTPPSLIGTGGVVDASTVYGTVSMNSNSAFTVRPGYLAYDEIKSGSSEFDSKFTDLLSKNKIKKYNFHTFIQSRKLALDCFATHIKTQGLDVKKVDQLMVLLNQLKSLGVVI